MKLSRTVIYKNTKFDDFVVFYLNRLPNEIIPEITNVKITKKEEQSGNFLKVKSIVTLYDESPRILKKFGFNLTKGEIAEKTKIFFDKKLIITEAVNKTLSTFLKVHEKEVIQEVDGNIIWKSIVKVWCLIPGGFDIALDRYQEFKRLEKQIMDTFLNKKGIEEWISIK